VGTLREALDANEVHAKGPWVTEILFGQRHSMTPSGFQEPAVSLFVKAIGCSKQIHALKEVLESRSLDGVLGPPLSSVDAFHDLPHLLRGTRDDTGVAVTNHDHALSSHVSDVCIT
jgi:hypothetical protein